MSTKFCVTSVLLFVVIGFVAGAENYMDYGAIPDEIPEKSPAENIHQLYRLLLQHRALQNDEFGGIPLEHLMIRKSQRSPSLRLRFGRSDPHMSMGVLPRPISVIASPRFDDNN